MLFVHYPKCTTCKRAKKWLDEHQISYEERDIKENNPSLEELKEWYQRSGLPLKRFFNTSGMLYKEMKLKDKLPEMSEDETAGTACFRRNARKASDCCDKRERSCWV